MINLKLFGKKRLGMIVPLVVCFILLLALFFLTVINRVRQETTITNRVSVGERVYQAAVAVGRVGIRRLARDFEVRKPITDDFFDAIWQGKRESKVIDYTEEVKSINTIAGKDIIGLDGLVASFKKEWGKNGSIDFKVTYQAKLDDEGFSNLFGGKMKADSHECKGRLVFKVVATHLGVSKTYTVEKEFLYVKLLAPPFYRFTLFSHKGTSKAVSDKANCCKFKDTGELSGSQLPMVCLNEQVGQYGRYRAGLWQVRRNTRVTRFLDYILDLAYIPDSDKRAFSSSTASGNEHSFVKNGWIYLGGKSDDVLTLNVAAGLDCSNNETNFNSYFGEFFHFYYDDDSLGWLSSKEWAKWLKDKVSSTEDVQIAFVDYGLFNGLFEFECHGDRMFDHKLVNIGNLYAPSQGEGTPDASSMHLFGTPSFCTPTLIFGQVKRAYLRAFAFYFDNLKAIMPIPAKYKPGWQIFWDKNKLQDYYTARGGSDNLIETLVKAENQQIKNFSVYLGGISKEPYNTPGLIPCVQRDAYLSCLKNICAHTNPDGDWSSIISNCPYLEKPDSLCKNDYEFSNDEEINYTGKLSELVIDKKYLRDRVTYKLKPDGSNGWENKELILKKCSFLKSKFITEAKDFSCLELGQIIEIDGNLRIDMPLKVLKGGIILVNGDITIDAPILNEWLSNEPETPDADSFGFLTLVGNNITITAKAPTTEGFTYTPPVGQIHAFLVAMNSGSGKLNVNKRCHIVGGVAADDISDLVSRGCIIEWGMENNEDMNSRDCYGISFGPRDIEIVSDN